VCIILAHWLKTTPAQLTTRGNGVPQNAHMRRRNQLGHGWWSVGHAGVSPAFGKVRAAFSGLPGAAAPRRSQGGVRRHVSAHRH